MIFIVVKFPIRPEKSGQWLSLIDEFTQACRAEPGNLFFDWAQSVDTPHEFVLTEGFASEEAGAEHVASEHFKKVMTWLPDVIADTPDIINVTVDGNGWSKMGELHPSSV